MDRVYWTYKGVTKTNGQWAKEYGLSPEALLRRMRMGWTIEKALNAPIAKAKTYMYQGVPMTITELSKLNRNISRETMYKRIVMYKWDPRCAVNVRNTNQSRQDKEHDIGFGITRPQYCSYPKCDECPYPDCVA